MAKRKTKKPNLISKIKEITPELLVISGVFFVFLSFTHRLLRWRSLSIGQETVSKYEVISNTLPTPTHIYIPWNTDADIEPGIHEEGSWTVSPNKVTYLASSAKPGEEGNIIIYGHNKRSILGNIRVLKGGENITLTLSDGSTRAYQVDSVKEVAPKETSLLAPSSSETLTLFTCSGFLDSQRFVVRALPTSL